MFIYLFKHTHTHTNIYENCKKFTFGSCTHRCEQRYLSNL